MQSSDLLFQQFSTVQSGVQQRPNTIASAASIAVTSFLTFITGTTAIANIAPPVDGLCLIALVFTDANPSAFTGAGNVQSTKDPADNELVLLCWDPSSAKWYAVS